MLILWLLFLVSSCSVYVSAWFSTNVTVDDTYGNEATSAPVSYDPQGFWSDVQNCTESGGTVCPSPERAYNHTWHAVAEYGTAQISFSGTALYVYCILAQNHTTDLTFWLDNDVVDTFSQSAYDSSTIQYDVLVYANEALSWGAHTFTLVNQDNSLGILDYITYTTHAELVDPTQPHGLDSQTKAIVAAVTVVGIVVLAALGGAVYYWKRHPYNGYKPPVDLFCKRGVARPNAPGAPTDLSGDAWGEGALKTQRSTTSMRGLLVPELAPRMQGPPATMVSTGSSTSVNENPVAMTVEAKNPIAEASPPVLIPCFVSHTETTESNGGMSAHTRPGAYQTAHPPLVVAIPQGGLGDIIVEETSHTALSKSLPPLPSEESSPRNTLQKQSPSAQRRSTPSSSGLSSNPPTAFPSSPPSSRRGRRPRSEVASSAKRRSTANGSATPSTDKRTSGMNASDRTTPSTPHSMAPSGFWIDNTSTPDLPARADSVKTVSTMPMGRVYDRFLGNVYVDTTPLPDILNSSPRTNTDKSSDTASQGPGTAWTTSGSMNSNARSLSPTAAIDALEPVPMVDTRRLVDSPASLPNSPSAPLLAATLEVLASEQMARISAYSDSALPVGGSHGSRVDAAEVVSKVPELPPANAEDAILPDTAVSMAVSAPSEDDVEPSSDTQQPGIQESSAETDAQEATVPALQPANLDTAESQSPPLPDPIILPRVNIAGEDRLDSPIVEVSHAISSPVSQLESKVPVLSLSIARQEGERLRRLPPVPLPLPSPLRLDTVHEDVVSPRFFRPLPRPQQQYSDENRLTSSSSTISSYSADNAEVAVGERLTILGPALQVVSPRPSAPLQLRPSRDLLGQWPSDSSDDSSLSNMPVALTRENSASSAGINLVPNQAPGMNIPKIWSRPYLDRSQSSQNLSTPAESTPPRRTLPLVPNRHPGVVLGTMLLPGGSESTTISLDILSQQSSVKTTYTTPLLPNRHPVVTGPMGPRSISSDTASERAAPPSQAKDNPSRRFGL